MRQTIVAEADTVCCYEGVALVSLPFGCTVVWQVQAISTSAV